MLPEQVQISPSMIGPDGRVSVWVGSVEVRCWPIDARDVVAAGGSLERPSPAPAPEHASPQAPKARRGELPTIPALNQTGDGA